jgi:hypothetical protein
MEQQLTAEQVIESELTRWRAIEEWRASAKRWRAEMRAGERSEADTLEMCELARYQISVLENLNGESGYE